MPEDWDLRGRHGHSTTLVEVDGDGYLVIVGGGIGNILEHWGVEEFFDVAILDLKTWTWIGHFMLQCGTTGTDFRGPGRHHVACQGLPGQILLMGGGRRPGRQVCSLDASRCIRMALAGQVTGNFPLSEVQPSSPQDLQETGSVPRQPALPTGRKMHGAACLLPWAPLVVIFGGWETGPHFDDLWVFAIGAEQKDLQDFRCLAATVNDNSGEEEDEMDDESEEDGPGSAFVVVNLRGSDGGTRTLRIPRRMLDLLQQNGNLQRSNGNEDEENEEE